MSFGFGAAASGFLLGAGLIIAIGAQNALVLAQGLRREHVFLVSTMGFVSDAILVAVGVAGLGAFVAANPTVTAVAAWGGAVFLFAYGAMALHKAIRPGALTADGRPLSRSARSVATTMLAVTWLNPHVYLDTVVLLGSISGQYSGQDRLAFGTGAVVSSAAWFYGLGYGAHLLAPIFARPMAWRLLDIFIAIVMWSIAASLVLEQLRAA